MYLNEKRRSFKNRKMFLRVSICFPQHSPADHPYKHIRSTLTNQDRLFYHLKVSSTELEDDNLFELYLLSKYARSMVFEKRVRETYTRSWGGEFQST